MLPRVPMTAYGGSGGYRMDSKSLVSLILAIAVPITLIGSFMTRFLGGQRRGIGWKFLRFNTIIIVLILAALLAWAGALTEASAAILAGALGYAFGKSEDAKDKE